MSAKKKDRNKKGSVTGSAEKVIADLKEQSRSPLIKVTLIT